MTPKVTSPAVASPADAANTQNVRGSSLAARRTDVGAGGTPAARASQRRGSPVLRRSQTSSAIAAAPGTASTANAGHSTPVSPTTAATSSGPANAPTWSSALCTPNPRPRPTGPAAYARRVDLAGLRTALPVRSASTSTQPTTSPAAPRKGVTASRGTHTAVRA